MLGRLVMPIETPVPSTTRFTSRNGALSSREISERPRFFLAAMLVRRPVGALPFW